MSTRTPQALTICIVAVLAAAPRAAVCSSTDGEAAADLTEICYRQQYIQQQFRRLTGRMMEVAAVLAKSDPASARLIREAVAEAHRSDVTANMGKVIRHLNEGLAAVAGEAQSDVLKDLKEVLRLLESGATRPEDLDPLKAILIKLEAIIRQQQAHVRDAGKRGGTNAELDWRAARQQATADRTRTFVAGIVPAGPVSGPPLIITSGARSFG